MCYIRKRQCIKTAKETLSVPLMIINLTFIFHEHLKPRPLTCKCAKKSARHPKFLALLLAIFGLSTHNNQHASVPIGSVFPKNHLYGAKNLECGANFFARVNEV